RILYRYNACYGVRFEGELATPERRRVCKAILVHNLEQSLSEVGTYFNTQVEFRCENTAMGRRLWSDELNKPIAALQPNTEFDTIAEVFRKRLEKKEVLPRVDEKARSACEFVSRCKWALRFDSFSIRRIASCFAADDSLHRTLMVDTVANVIF